ILRFNSTGRTSWHLMYDAYARGPENVWVAGGGPFHWDGAKWTAFLYENREPFGSGVIETWASENAEYACVVGLNRACGYYRKGDREFTKLNIPDQMDCIDLVGFEDGTVYVASGDVSNGIIYKVTPDEKVLEYHRFSGGEPRAIWWQDGDIHYAKHFEIRRIVDSGNGLVDRYVFEAKQQFLEEDHDEENNIYFMLQRGYFLHWNGSTYKEILIPYPGEFWSHDIDVNGKDVYFVGFGTGQYCVIAHGRQI
ncbi:MAG: hypothetical protein RBU27_13265, partial [Bacteroidota bacterium]|nr:hypothetical protein [Bacteroidota bacterium]